MVSPVVQLKHFRPVILYDLLGLPISGANPVPVTGTIVVTPPVNRASFIGFTKTVAVPGTAEKCATHAVPNGFSVAIKAIPTNTKTVWIGGTKAEAEAHNVSLTPSGSGVNLFLTNTDEIWVDATIAGEGIELAVEQ